MVELSPEIRLKIRYAIQSGSRIDFASLPDHSGNHRHELIIEKWHNRFKDFPSDTITCDFSGDLDWVARSFQELVSSKDPPLTALIVFAYLGFEKMGEEYSVHAYDVTDLYTPLYTDFPKKNDSLDFARFLSLIKDTYNHGRSRGKLVIPPCLLKAGLVVHKLLFDPTPVEKTYTIEDTISVYRYPAGEYCQILPVPPFGLSTDPDVAHQIENPHKWPDLAILVGRYGSVDSKDNTARSTMIWKSLVDVSRITENTDGSIVLLTGPPGAGKDVFAGIIHHGARPRRNGAFKTYGVQGQSLEKLGQRLFGSVGASGRVSGLIEESSNGTLFLDEFDKASTDEDRKDFYNSLLRVFEAKEFWPISETAAKRVDNVQWVLGGAFSDIQSKVPPDLWTRLTNHLDLQNPIAERGYAQAMFIFWHYKEIMAWYDKPMETLIDNNEFKADVAKALLFGRSDIRKMGTEAFTPSEELLEFALDYEIMLVNTTDPIDGIRALRQSAIVVSQYWLEIVTNAYQKLWKDRCQFASDIKVLTERCGNTDYTGDCPTDCRNRRCCWWLRDNPRRDALAMARKLLEMTRRK